MDPLYFCQLASLAYDLPPDIGIADSSSRAIVRYNDDKIIIAFRGSDDLMCFVRDIDIRIIHVDKIGHLHEGFYNSYLPLRESIFKLAKDNKIVFTGHSLGAAVAIIATLDLINNGYAVDSVWGFEPPRVTKDINIFDSIKDVPIFLYRNGNDIITEEPLGWVHPRPLIHLTSPKHTLIELVPNLHDHLISNVESSLKNYLSANSV